MKRREKRDKKEKEIGTSSSDGVELTAKAKEQLEIEHVCLM